MQINQDTYTNGSLYFGATNSKQRHDLYEYRINIFREIILVDYPEFYIKLQGDRHSISKYVYRLKKLSFKHSNKLVCALSYNLLESVNTNEFKIMMQRFSRFLTFHKDVAQELQIIFNQSLI